MKTLFGYAECRPSYGMLQAGCGCDGLCTTWFVGPRHDMRRNLTVAQYRHFARRRRRDIIECRDCGATTTRADLEANPPLYEMHEPRPRSRYQ